MKASLAALCGAPGAPAPAPTARPFAAAPAAAASAPPRRQKLLLPGLIGLVAVAALAAFYFLWPHSPGDNGTANQVAAATPAAGHVATPAQPAAAPAPAEPATDGTFTQAATINDATASIDLRGGPSGEAFVIGRIARGDVFTTFPQEGGWWRVRTADGTIGYLPHGQIRVMVPGAAEAPDYRLLPTKDVVDHIHAKGGLAVVAYPESFNAWDTSVTFDVMPDQFTTLRTELNYRHASVPYFAMILIPGRKWQG